MRTPTRIIIGLALASALGGAASLAQAQQVSAHVISSTPIRDANGQTGYSVVYEYAGQRYTTRTDSPPGQTIALQLSPMGVATSPVPNQPPQAAYNDPNPQNWDNVAVEPGVVVGAGAAPPPAYGAAPVYGAPVYAPGYAPPVYVAPAYGYGYASPWIAAPIGLSLNFGYARGWGGGWHRGWH